MEKDDWFKTLLGFDKMLAPLILKGLYFLGLVFAVIGGIVAMFTSSFLHGLVALLLGPIFIRLWCEIMIVVFGIHENLVTLRKLKEREAKDTLK